MPARGRGRGRVQNKNPVNDYVQGTSMNLPSMSYLKIVEYFQKLRSPELRQAKDSISGSTEYGDSAIGYVKIMRDKFTCNVQARVTPQTSVNNKPYEVGVVIKENDKSIVEASCIRADYWWSLGAVAPNNQIRWVRSTQQIYVLLHYR